MNTKLREMLNERKKNKERGNSLVVYVLWMPLLFGSFGVAVDGAIGIYTNSTLQSAMDTGTQSALSRATNPGTGGNTTANPQLTTNNAHNYFIQLYDANRTDTGANNKNPFLICQTSAAAMDTGDSYAKLITSAPSHCGWTENSFTYDQNQARKTIDLTTRVTEKSAPVFIHVLGIKQVTYHLTSSARVTYAYG